MKPILVITITSLFFCNHSTLAQKAIKTTYKTESGLTNAGRKTLYTGGGFAALGGILYLGSVGSRDSSGRGLTLKGAGLRVLGIASLGIGVATAAVGGVMFGIGKSHDALRRKKKTVGILFSPNSVGMVVKF